MKTHEFRPCQQAEDRLLDAATPAQAFSGAFGGTEVTPKAASRFAEAGKPAITSPTVRSSERVQPPDFQTSAQVVAPSEPSRASAPSTMTGVRISSSDIGAIDLTSGRRMWRPTDDVNRLIKTDSGAAGPALRRA